MTPPRGIAVARSRSDDPLPNPGPRPEGELEELERVWCPPSGWRFITAVNNTYVGLYYVGASLLFFILAGILALLIRAQLAVPQNDLIGHDLYNQLFTMHGTIMMFLFAVPAVEALSVYLLPNMLGARDLPFPRLSAYAFWAYFAGGLAFFCSLFFDVAPDGGWFMYPPLTSYEYSPGIRSDFWLLGIGFIEISAIAGAVEIIVGILRTRAPGMTLGRIPVYAWAMLVFGFMIVFAFPAVILSTLLLELERAFHWPFFIAERGGDPLLWQHLFWFFGHPEVYIIFLPAAGVVSMIVPTMVRTPLMGYRLVVLAIVATGFLSFGLWVHHMFATGIPQLSLSFFSAASMAVSVPSGIQVFAWIATIASGKLRLTTPALFILGFLFIFTLGGLTGVMVAMVPFDWEAHDTYFVVAHLHYVLIGGMVFPFFAAMYYWIPTASDRPLSERLGRWVFGLMFAGVNLTFFPMHIFGLQGMPRRVYTYPTEMDWGALNFVSTLGAFLIALGVALFLIDMIRNFRPGAGKEAGNVWDAGTLEWLPSDTYATRSIPFVRSREPIWDQPNLAKDVEAGHYYLPGTVSGGRETIVTSTFDARPQYVHRLPGPSLPTVLAALFTAAFFILLTVKVYMPAVVCGVLAIVMILRWLWETDPGEGNAHADIGGGLRLPIHISGPSSVSWWGVVVLLLVLGTLFACMLGTYLYLWLVNPGDWPPPGTELPPLAWPAAVALLYVATTVAAVIARRRIPAPDGTRPWAMRSALVAALVFVTAALIVEIAAQWQTGLRPSAHSYGAAVYATLTLQGVFVVLLLFAVPYSLARSLTGKLHTRRRLTLDNTILFFYYAVGQGLVALLTLHFFPRLVP